jgi:hypothetical protein
VSYAESVLLTVAFVEATAWLALPVLTKVKIALPGALADSSEETVRLTVMEAVELSLESDTTIVAEWVLPGAIAFATEAFTATPRTSGVVPLVSVSHWFAPLAALQ